MRTKKQNWKAKSKFISSLAGRRSLFITCHIRVDSHRIASFNRKYERQGSGLEIATFSANDGLRRSDGVVSFSGITLNCSSPAGITDEGTRSISSNNANIVDGDIIAVADGIGWETQTLDVFEIIPCTVHWYPEAIALRSPDHDDISRPVGCKGSVGNRGSRFEIIGVERFANNWSS